ncbi:methyl-accepting chemotaxis protein [Limisalsivibrio acetivorans]|uniref:methyl-accepting chemotaxis protein n=1 Tax=Limisalsivibrio acetivorans TaxID=1304888 RepID=UPI0003B32B0D|nr:methyl-accepting chemotaxis protein [Limisalsivibrio acetivorans]
MGMRFTIKMRVIISLLGAILIPVLILSLLSINKIRKDTYENFTNSTKREIRQIENSIEIHFKGVRENVEYMAKHPIVKQADDSITTYYDTNTENKMTPSSNGGIEEDIYDVYERFASTHKDLAYVYMATKHGGYIQWPEGTTGAKYDPRKRPFYKAAVNAGGTTRTPAYYFAADDVVIVSTVTNIKDSRGNFIGVQGMDVSLKGLTDMIKSITIGKTGYLMLVQDDGTVLADPSEASNNFKKLTELEGEGYNTLSSSSNGHYRVSLGDKEYEANIYTSPELGWKFIGLIESSEIKSVINRVTLTYALTGVLLVGIFALIALYVSMRITKPIIRLKNMIEDIAEGGGDLRNRLQVKRNDEISDLAFSFNKFVDKINHLVIEVKHNALNVSSSSQEISAATEELSTVFNNTNAQTQSIAAALEELSRTSESISSSVDETRNLAKNASENTREGGEIIRKTIDGMNSIQDEVGSLSRIISELNSSTDKIGDILDVINDIADQTNLLALNAAIEAARAGEAGRGFAVVADEVRKLAEKTSTATQEITGIISTLQNETTHATSSMEKVSKEVGRGADLGEDSLVVLDKIVDAGNRILEAATNVSAAVNQEVTAIGDINSNIREMADSSDESNLSIQEVAKSSDSLAKDAEELTSLVSRFKTDD